MNRIILTYALLAAAVPAMGAQEASQSNPYQGTSNPPSDEAIVTMSQPKPKPQAEVPAAGQAAQAGVASAPQYSEAQPQQAAPLPEAAQSPAAEDSTANDAALDGTDGGIVVVEDDTPTQPALNQRAHRYDSDGDIVHPAPLPPGELGEGATIRTRLLGRISTAYNQTGDKFRTRVASDVLQDGQVLIPAGSEIDGTVVHVSSGHLGGHGSMLLRPETVQLPDGSRYRLYAQVASTPGSRNHVSSEGVITPGSRLKKDGIEYGGATGAGVITGAILAGGPGALAGGIVGAGVITVHLLVSHPQATLEYGTPLVFSLTEPLNLVPSGQSGN